VIMTWIKPKRHKTFTTQRCGESADISEPIIEGKMDIHAWRFG